MAGIKFVPEGRASVFSFVLGLGVVCIPLLSAAGSDIAWVQTLLLGIRTKIAIAVYVASVNGLLLVLYKGPVYQGVEWKTLQCWWGCFEEGVEWKTLTCLWGCFAAELKPLPWLSVLGLLMVLIGECLRKSAMLTAGSNFNHIVQNEKAQSHVLVTAGVYSWFRHPSYVGWFYWSIGTQVLLCNPLCVLGYALASWRFFRERIDEEEITLIHFFGEDYLEYKSKVPTGLPFITGIKMEP
ncbi:UNVERIFIED_CONTAM: hypothetical protein FKN15_049320 [Acipenser sinensis]